MIPRAGDTWSISMVAGAQPSGSINGAHVSVTSTPAGELRRVLAATSDGAGPGTMHAADGSGVADGAGVDTTAASVLTAPAACAPGAPITVPTDAQLIRSPAARAIVHGVVVRRISISNV